jgi:hypothetical protein
MPRREYRASFKCAEPGCRDTRFFAVSTRAEEKEIYASQHRSPYRCSRHRDKDANLRPGNEQTRRVLIASKVPAAPIRGFPDAPRWLDGLFWLEEGKERAGSGFSFGPGFTAYASDFPEGTRLVVTAQIEMPASCPVCRDTGVVQCAETNPEDGAYETACTEPGRKTPFPVDADFTPSEEAPY